MPQQPTDYDRMTPLFREFADESTSAARRTELRNRIITEFLPVAEHIAGKYRNRTQPLEDLVQVARLGLINAVDRFDPDHGSDFLSFAVPTITGEVRRYFRDATWALRVPRRLKEVHAAISRCTEQLTRELGRSPRPSDIAEKLDLPLEEIYDGLQAGDAYTTASFDAASPEGQSWAFTDLLGGPDPDLELVENRAVLYPALATLPAREASIVVMRFFDSMTQSQIAERIGCSQMHVSRLLAASLRQLRDRLQRDEQTVPAE